MRCVRAYAWVAVRLCVLSEIARGALRFPRANRSFFSASTASRWRYSHSSTSELKLFRKCVIESSRGRCSVLAYVAT